MDVVILDPNYAHLVLLSVYGKLKNQIIHCFTYFPSTKETVLIIPKRACLLSACISWNCLVSGALCSVIILLLFLPDLVLQTSLIPAPLTVQFSLHPIWPRSLIDKKYNTQWILVDTKH